MDYRKGAFAHYLRTGDDTELRAMGVATGSNGGFMVPEDYQRELTVTMKSFGRVFSAMRHVPTNNGRVMRAPVAQFSGSGSLVAENPVSAIGTADRTYSQVTLNGYTVTSGIHKLSFALDEDSAFPVQGVISDFAGEMIGRALATLSVSGTGSNQPTGVYVAGAATALTLTAGKAVTIDGAASTELTSKALAPSTLRAMVAALDSAYDDGNAAWYMSPTTFAAQCAVTDTAGQPLIRPQGPRQLYGYPIVIASELSDLTASAVSGPILANLDRAYYWRDAGTEILRLGEKYADSGSVGYVAFWRGDLEPRDVRALVTVKAAAT